MKKIIASVFAVLFACGTLLTANAQNTSGKYQVTTRLKESTGTYQERELYRGFLTEYMKACPYISHFSVQEAVGSADNHDVVWRYQVNSWNDITAFYAWVNNQLKSSDDNGLKKAMTPYAPVYAIGGQIDVQKKGKQVLAKK
jgi:hypothetical protein